MRCAVPECSAPAASPSEASKYWLQLFLLSLRKGQHQIEANLGAIEKALLVQPDPVLVAHKGALLILLAPNMHSSAEYIGIGKDLCLSAREAFRKADLAPWQRAEIEFVYLVARGHIVSRAPSAELQADTEAFLCSPLFCLLPAPAQVIATDLSARLQDQTLSALS